MFLSDNCARHLSKHLTWRVGGRTDWTEAEVKSTSNPSTRKRETLKATHQCCTEGLRRKGRDPPLLEVLCATLFVVERFESGIISLWTFVCPHLVSDKPGK